MRIVDEQNQTPRSCGLDQRCGDATQQVCLRIDTTGQLAIDRGQQRRQRAERNAFRGTRPVHPYDAQTGSLTSLTQILGEPSLTHPCRAGQNKRAAIVNHPTHKLAKFGLPPDKRPIHAHAGDRDGFAIHAHLARLLVVRNRITTHDVNPIEPPKDASLLAPRIVNVSNETDRSR
ncbi:MAG TPA: hypothetical protein VJ777_22330, partial [Mycobacterium sp.]|nr:hypothetical protein [Mycobacterium sp.]